MVTHLPDYYGKDILKKFYLGLGKGKSTKLGMLVCASKGRFISVGVRGRHSNGSKKAEYASDVEEIDETG